MRSKGLCVPPRCAQKRTILPETSSMSNFSLIDRSLHSAHMATPRYRYMAIQPYVPIPRWVYGHMALCHPDTMIGNRLSRSYGSGHIVVRQLPITGNCTRLGPWTTRQAGMGSASPYVPCSRRRCPVPAGGALFPVLSRLVAGDGCCPWWRAPRSLSSCLSLVAGGTSW